MIERNFVGPVDFTRYLQVLKAKRAAQKRAIRKRRPKRRNLSLTNRQSILEKTSGRCHICGGAVGSTRWQADHVLALSGGGTHLVDNYLPAHRLCNNYRWDYLPDEFQYILKLGVWARTQVEKETKIGRTIAERFTRAEAARLRRRRTGG